MKSKSVLILSSASRKHLTFYVENHFFKAHVARKCGVTSWLHSVGRHETFGKLNDLCSSQGSVRRLWCSCVAHHEKSAATFWRLSVAQTVIFCVTTCFLRKYKLPSYNVLNNIIQLNKYKEILIISEGNLWNDEQHGTDLSLSSALTDIHCKNSSFATDYASFWE
jgi:hypothetical protein